MGWPQDQEVQCFMQQFVASQAGYTGFWSSKTTLGQNSEVESSPVAKIWEDITRKLLFTLQTAKKFRRWNNLFQAPWLVNDMLTEGSKISLDCYHLSQNLGKPLVRMKDKVKFIYFFF